MHIPSHRQRTSRPSRSGRIHTGWAAGFDPAASAPAGKQGGFTMVELMIAMVALSAVLLIITVGVIFFSRSYYGGLNRSRVQNTARSIISSISQGIQFTGTVVATTDDTDGSYFCAGGKVYVFKAGVKYGGGTATATNPGLYVAPQSASCATPAAGAYNNPQAQQLLGDQMRITSLTVKKIGSQLYSINLTLAYGDDDLLSAVTGADVSCKNQTGSQFCAVSKLSATVQQRLADSRLSN